VHGKKGCPRFPEHVETDSLRGERIVAADFDRLREMNVIPAVMHSLGGLRDEAGTRSLLDCLLEDWRNDGFGLWWLWDRADNASVGHGGLRRVRVEGADEVEMDYALLPQFWGKGYATEIAKLSVDLAEHELRLSNLIGFTDATNAASQRVMEKAGFAFEKDIMHVGGPQLLHRIRFDA
jgi:RimJ/RimL family protein N-acetyltransferase